MWKKRSKFKSEVVFQDSNPGGEWEIHGERVWKEVSRELRECLLGIE